MAKGPACNGRADETLAREAALVGVIAVNPPAAIDSVTAANELMKRDAPQRRVGLLPLIRSSLFYAAD